MSLESELLQKGHEVSKKGNLNDIFIPKELQNSFVEILYLLMSKPSFRKELRDWTFKTEEPSTQVSAYLKLCELFMPTSFTKDQNRYSKTFEWYISEVLMREFSAKASGFGVVLKGANGDDEFDCIAVFDGGLFFVECKTGRDPIQTQVSTYIRRDAELSARYSMFILDRDYLFSKEIPDEPSFTREEARQNGINEIKLVRHDSHSFYYCRSISKFERHFFICLANIKNLKQNIRHVIRYTNMLDDRHYDFDKQYKQENIPFRVLPVPPEVSLPTLKQE